MTIAQGDKLPAATLLRLGANGPEAVDLASLLKGRKVVIFAVPGAFTPTCHSAHMPSFIRTKDALAAKGVDEIVCVAVNDPFVMDAWAKATGADKAGITVLSDGDASFTKALGLDFSAPPAGLVDRSKRYAMVVDDSAVSILHLEESPGVCETSAGEAIVAAL